MCHEARFSWIEDRMNESLDLPRDISPETDLWPGIAARIDASTDRAIGQLPRSIEPARDLWPDIQAQVSGRERTHRVGLRFTWPNLNVAAAAGVLAMGTLVLTSFIGTRSPAPPSWPSDTPARIAGILADLPGADLQQAAWSIERDFLMLRAERLRIEQALATSEGDSNLRDQWRRVYLAELRLIDTAEKLVIIHGTGSAI